MFSSDEFSDSMDGALWTEEELEKICRAYIADSMGKKYNEEQLMEIIQWMERVRLDQAILDTVLNGDVIVMFPPERKFGDDMFFKLSDAKRDEMDKLFSDPTYTKEKFIEDGLKKEFKPFFFDPDSFGTKEN